MEKTQPPPTQFPNLFEEYIIRGTGGLIAPMIALGEDPLPDDLRDRARHLLTFSLKLPAAWPQARELLIALAPKMEQAGHRDDAWLRYLQQGLAQSQALRDGPAEAELQLQVGFLYQLRNQYDQATAHLNTSIQRFAQAGDARGQARAVARLAYVCWLQRRHNRAEALAQDALALLAEDDAERGFSLAILGMIAADRQEWDRAESCLRKAVAYAEQAGDHRLLAKRSNWLGLCLQYQRKHDEALVCYQTASSWFERLGDTVEKVAADVNIGNVYSEIGQFKTALQIYEKVEPVWYVVQDESHLARLHNNKGYAYSKDGQYHQARDEYQRSIHFWRNTTDRASLINVLDGLSIVYMQMGNYKQAIAILEEALAELERIQEHPAYKRLVQMIQERLREAGARRE